jgi:hypothetical protein
MRLSTRIRPARNVEDAPVDPARAEHDRAVREARLELARRMSAWTEIPETRLVRRGRYLVDAETDLVHLIRRGHVFGPGTVPRVRLAVHAADLLRRPGRPVGLPQRTRPHLVRDRRPQSPPRKRNVSHTCFLRFGRVYDPHAVLGPVRGNGAMYDRGAFRKFNLDRLAVVVDHDMARPIGVVREIVEHEDTDGTWWAALATIPEPPGWLKRGAGVSFGFKNLHRADVNGWEVVRDALLDEISVLHLMHPGDPGAKVLTLHRTESSPARVTSDRPAAGEVIYHEQATTEQAIRDGDPYMVEVLRRMDWAERRTGRQADMEIVLRDMQRELHGPSLDDVYAAHRAQRPAA